MKKWFFILTGFMTLGCSYQTKVLSEQEFTKIYLDSLNQAYANVKFEIVNDMTIKASYNGKELTKYLYNAYKEYESNPKSLSEILKKHISVSASLFNEKKAIRKENIIPIVKPIEYLDELRRLSKENGEEKEPWVVYENYNEELIIVFGEDTENSIEYFSLERFAELNINKDTLLEISVKNLQRILPEIEKNNENSLYRLVTGGDIESSLILLPNLWSKQNFDIKGDIVVSIPNKDVIFITGSENITELKKMREITEESYNTGIRSVSAYLFKFNGNKFERFK